MTAPLSRADRGAVIRRLAGMSRRRLIAEAERRGKHIMFPPLSEWTQQELFDFLARDLVDA